MSWCRSPLIAVRTIRYAPFTSHHMTARMCDAPAKRLLEPLGINCFLHHQISPDFLGAAQRRLGIGNITVLEADRHRPQPRRYFAQVVVALGAHQRPEDRAQPEIDAGLGPEFVRPEGQRIDRGDDLRTDAGVECEVRRI